MAELFVLIAEDRAGLLTLAKGNEYIKFDILEDTIQEFEGIDTHTTPPMTTKVHAVYGATQGWICFARKVATETIRTV